LERTQYPEKAQRESMLWDVHEWFQRQTDYNPRLRYDQVVSMGIPLDTDTMTDTGADVDVPAVERQNAQQLNRFVRLVNEGYIDAELRREFAGGPPFTSAVVRGLSEKGLLEIGELPDADQRLEQSLEALKLKIEGLTDVPYERRKKAIDAVDEIKQFARGLAPGIAIELGKAYLRGQGIYL
jgi:hypothetical protein